MSDVRKPSRDRVGVELAVAEMRMVAGRLHAMADEAEAGRNAVHVDVPGFRALADYVDKWARCVDQSEAAHDNEGAENGRSCAGIDASHAKPDNEGHDSRIRREPTETVDSPAWYTSGGVETIEKVEAVVEGLPAREAYLLGQVVRYVDRAGMKDEAAIDLGKANNYAHRLVRGKWRDHE